MGRKWRDTDRERAVSRERQRPASWPAARIVGAGGSALSRAPSSAAGRSLSRAARGAPPPEGRAAGRFAISQGELPQPAETSREPCRSEEHTSELPSLMRISYAVLCLKKNTHISNIHISYELIH